MPQTNRERWKSRLGPLYRLAVALQFMTRLPVPSDLDPELEDLADSAVWFPVVGGIVGGLMAAVSVSLQETTLVPAISACLVVLGGVLLTGAFHEDAVGDSADGFGGGWSRDQVLEIMRDSRVGTYATVVIAGVLGLRCISLIGMEPAHWLAALVCAHVAGRTSSLFMLKFVPYARREGEDPGFGKPLVEAQTAGRLVVGFATAATVCTLAAGWVGAVSVALILPIGLATGEYYKSRIGGMTGDCLGATNVVTELAVLLLFAALHPATSSAFIAA